MLPRVLAVFCLLACLGPSTDRDHDGVSQVWELAPLSGSGVESFELEYHTSRRRDRHGNWFRWASSVEIDGRRRPVVDVIFVGE